MGKKERVRGDEQQNPGKLLPAFKVQGRNS